MFLSEMSNREKSIWAEILLDVVIALYFFPRVFAMEGGVGANAGEMGGIIGVVIVIAIVGSAIIYGLFGVGKVEAEDERDYQIDAKAHRLGYWAVVSTISFLIGHMVLNEATKEIFGFQYEVMTPGQIVVYMLLSLTISAFVKDSAKLFYYRRGY